MAEPPAKKSTKHFHWIWPYYVRKISINAEGKESITAACKFCKTYEISVKTERMIEHLIKDGVNFLFPSNSSTAFLGLPLGPHCGQGCRSRAK